jgi:hypothetical protein
MRHFHLERKTDETGISGVGRVAEGVEFHDAQCVLKWNPAPSSLGVYNSISDLEAIHGHGGDTQIVWDD